MAALGSPLCTLRSLLRELRYVSAQAGRPYRDMAAYQHLRGAFRAHQITSEKLCRAQHELHFQAATYLCLLRSVREHLALHQEYHAKGERDTTRQRIKFSDDRVCKSHLLNCCPHDVLSGTRMDLGECLKVHDLALRADYEIASKEQDFFFELDAMDHLQSFIADCDRRTEVAKKRLAETQEEISAEVAAKAERVHELNEEIGKLLAKVEQLGADGNVEESQKVMDEVEKARAKKREAEEVYRNSMPASSFQQQKLRVCEVCSAYLGLHDNDRRLADHFGGKLHLGFIEIREKLEELRRVVADKQEKRNQERLKRREEREKEEREKLRRSRSHSKNPRRSRSRDRRRHRSRSASRERKRRTRSKSREKRHRHRSRSSSRSRSRSHQRSRHSSRDRSRERKKRSSKERSSRDKERSRDHDRTSRDKDRSSRERSPRDNKDRKRSYESANGRSEDRRSSEEREAGEI
ncbi:putative RNA-binding protein Luc7-like 2 isoform X4 [Gopherus evgoodei]|uniref:putative RNA-binding protein Luc7-like 2 isoform X4 n=1 Tax=Gopherus evgoodei TaxID=1825980 RepID=UPI0011CEFD3E|nr:putative RNA-binding protein Luc7-like 2 isoform X4 [Gopherus evgoodei]